MSANQLVREMTPGYGHNQPPLEEQIELILAPFRAHQAELLAVARTAVIVDAESAEKVTDLIVQLRAWEKGTDDAREALKRPYLDACRKIDTAFAGARQPVLFARYGENGKGGLIGMLTEYKRRIEREAEKAPAPIRSHLGTVGTRREPAFEIIDLRQLLGWLIKGPLKAQVEQAVKTIMGKYLRAMGIEAVEQGVTIPGFKAWVEKVAQVR